MVVKSDEDVDGYGDGDRGDPARRAVTPATHLQPLPPYYFILTVHNPLNTQHHNAYHASHNSFYHAYDNSLGDNAHDNADKHGLHHAQAATASTLL